jgi:cyclic pyranopterin phosphate synthase
MTTALGMPAIAPPRGGRSGAEPRPAVPGLVDTHGRVATDLRISLLDRCNLRCSYCMPEEGLDFLPAEQLLTPDELVRLARVAVTLLGVEKIRLTGGEPLLRPELVDLVAAFADLSPRPELALTTNGIGLKSRAARLREAGLDRINISLDTVHADTFAAMTRRPFLRQVMSGIDAALESGFASVKVNAVLLRGVNDFQAVDLVEWALDRGVELRFIENMPLGGDRSWQRAELITATEIRDRIRERFELVQDAAPRSGAPAERYLVRDAGRDLGSIGIIASVTEPFCEDCTRTRLTSEGRVRSCLFSHDETDLAGPLRAGATDDEVAELWRAAMWTKPAGSGISDDEFRQPERTMSAIGG